MSTPDILDGKVFVSHASKNFPVANDIRRRLEEQGIGCWIAPRDIPPGASYGSEIVTAIESSVAVVLVMTDEANASRAVANELELAFRNQRVIIPVRLKPVQPSSSLAFFINNTQWVDAFHTPLKERVGEIAKLVQAVRGGRPPPAPTPESKTFVGAVERQIEGLIRYKFLTAVTALAILASIGVTAALMSGKTMSILQDEQAKIDGDPATFGLVNLAAVSEVAPGSRAIPLRATVYMNLKDPRAAEVVWRAFGRKQGLPENEIDVGTLGAAQAPGAQSLSFEIAAESNVVVFCMTARHPSIGSRYTARWDFSIESTAGGINVMRAGSPKLSVASPGDCA